jgi:hypothetical protein
MCGDGDHVLLNITSFVLANDTPDPLNQVQLTLSAETWAKTSTARVVDVYRQINHFGTEGDGANS